MSGGFCQEKSGKSEEQDIIYIKEETYRRERLEIQNRKSVPIGRDRDGAAEKFGDCRQ